MSIYLVLYKSCTKVKESLAIGIFTCTWGRGLAVAVRCSGSSTFAEILIFIIQITCFSFLFIQHDSSLVLLLSSGQSKCGGGLHAELVSEYFSGSYVNSMRTYLLLVSYRLFHQNTLDALFHRILLGFLYGISLWRRQLSQLEWFAVWNKEYNFNIFYLSNSILITRTQLGR